MPIPVLNIARIAAKGAKKQFSEKLGRTVYRDARGKFVSYGTYKQLRSSAVDQEQKLRSRLGAPPKGHSNWVSIANKYKERFSAYL